MKKYSLDDATDDAITIVGCFLLLWLMTNLHTATVHAGIVIMGQIKYRLTNMEME